MFSQQLAKFKNETKIKTYLRARGSPGVSGPLHSLHILRIGRIGSAYELHHCVCHATLFPSRAWTDAKTKDIINCLYFTLILNAEARDYGKGRYISDVACGVRPITMHCARWPIRADCTCRKEGLCRKQSVWERRGIEDLQ